MIVEVRVSTNSKRPGVEKLEGGLKVRVKAKPLKGNANREVLQLVAAHFGVSESQVRIVRGASSSRKMIEVI